MLETQILGNSVLNYLLAAAIFIGLVFSLGILNAILLKRLKAYAEKTVSKIDDFLVQLVDKALWPLLYVAAFYFSTRALELNPNAADLLHKALVVIVIVQATRLVVAVALYAAREVLSKRKDGQPSRVISTSILSILKIVVWSLGVVLILDNLGFNVSAIIAGLGIGGIAVALAAQNILGDLFNYFVIFFDRPFEEGDFIIVEDYMGTIEHIGIKSTRLRSLGGEQIVISNSHLTSGKIRNYKRMQQRRILFKIGVVYETSNETLKKIPGLLRQIIEANKEVYFDRAHFASYGDYSLNFEVVYFVLSADYNRYMDIQQEINYRIKEAFEREGIEFAYPTTVEYQKRVEV
ncbi:MAG: mechanosensitive ion channel family protein [Candidatus Omnitrophica bacterium]|nr:mechanosensitive ion channel family protein [Candidatus Omnitrophota bacterium]